MSDTTGWKLDPEYHTYSKVIGSQMYHIDKRPSGKWMLSFGVTGATPRRTLRECQLLAHAVARLLDDPAKISY